MTTTDYLYKHRNIVSWFVEDGVLYIPGTNDLADWLTNLDIWLNSGTHRGFLRVYKRLLKEIDLASVHTVHGHSLGGALATLIAWKYPHIQCYTYGSPRVFSERIDIPNLTQFACDWDLVTKVPSWLYHGKIHQRETPFVYWNPHKYNLHT